jgi:hypothetical protein
MSSTEILTVAENGDMTLPADVIERYHIEKEMQFRRQTVLLIPLTTRDALRFPARS